MTYSLMCIRKNKIFVHFYEDVVSFIWYSLKTVYRKYNGIEGSPGIKERTNTENVERSQADKCIGGSSIFTKGEGY